MRETPIWYVDAASRTFILRGYLPRLALLSLVWEIAQLPLYTIWREARPGTIAYAVAHCTVGDILIGVISLILALILCGARDRATWPARRIAALTVLVATSYTAMSELLNLARGSWAYSPWMPVLPWIGVGLSPLMQWIAVPAGALRWARHRYANHAS